MRFNPQTHGRPVRIIIFAQVEVAGHSLPGWPKSPKTLNFRADLVATGKQRSNTCGVRTHRLRRVLLILNVILNSIAGHADLECLDTLHPKLKTYAPSSKYIELWSARLSFNLLYMYCIIMEILTYNTI